MTEEARTRERITRIAASLHARGLTHGSTGNISVRMSDCRLLATPTGSSLGWIDPGDLALIDTSGRHVSGLAPTKEMPLHSAFYAGREIGAVVHLHSHYSVALSMAQGIDPKDVLPKLTPYATMLLGRVRLLPYFRPGDPAVANSIRAMDIQTSAVILSNHGPVVAGADLDRATCAIEELEATARLVLELQGRPHRGLTAVQLADLAATFGGVP